MMDKYQKIRRETALNKRGFTIIEVMIVLAIAGLIMVIVFYAVRQVVNSEKEHARHELAGRVKADLDTYAGLNQGDYPFNDVPFDNTYHLCNTILPLRAGDMNYCNYWLLNFINGKVNIIDPGYGTDTNIWIGYDSITSTPSGFPVLLPSGLPAAGNLYIDVGSRCNGETATHQTGDPAGGPYVKQYSVIIFSAGERFYCIDS